MMKTNINMNKIITTLVVLTNIIFWGCQPNSNELENKYWRYAIKNNNLDGFLTFAANFPNSERTDSCITYMQEILLSKPNIGLASGYYLDTVENKVLISFINLAEFDYFKKKQNAFVLTVADTGLIFDNKSITNEGFYKRLKSYHSEYWSQDENYPQSKPRKNKYFGNILVSKVCVVLETDKSSLTSEDSINWDLYLNTIQLVKNSYLKIWDEKANLIWEKNLHDLDYDKQEAILETAIIEMELNFIKRTFYQGEL